jgi:tetratricopeptide (TPR) repeat protein
MTILLAVLLCATACPASTSEAAREPAWQAYVQGQLLANDGRFAEALDRLQQAARRDPAQPEAHYAIGQALIGLRRFPEAVEELRTCRALFECRASLDAGQRAALRRTLDEESAEVRRAITAAERGQLTESMVLWKDVNGDAVPREETRRLVQQLEAHLQELEQWKKHGLDARAQALVAVALGTALFQGGALAPAEEEYRRAIALDPDNADAHHDLVVVYLALGRAADAERELKALHRAGMPVDNRLEDAVRKAKLASPRP